MHSCVPHWNYIYSVHKSASIERVRSKWRIYIIRFAKRECNTKRSSSERPSFSLLIIYLDVKRTFCYCHIVRQQHTNTHSPLIWLKLIFWDENYTMFKWNIDEVWIKFYVIFCMELNKYWFKLNELHCIENAFIAVLLRISSLIISCSWTFSSNVNSQFTHFILFTFFWFVLGWNRKICYFQ